MFVRLLLLLTVVPFVELVILLRLAEWLHWDGTIALVVFTGVLGAWLARREGVKAVTKIQTDLAAGVAPAGAVIDGLLILIAGVVLVTPGVLTDLCGFGLLIPPVRRLVARRLAKAFTDRIVIMHPHSGVGPMDDGFIDVPGTSRNAENGTEQLP